MTPDEALQATLAAEHAAVYVYGVLGGRVSVTRAADTADLFRAAYDVHRGRRDLLRSRLAALGQTPVPASAAYRVEARSRATRALVAVARTTEQRCAETYAQQVASTSDADRAWAVEALTDAAVRQLGFGAGATAYPGLPSLG